MNKLQLIEIENVITLPKHTDKTVVDPSCLITIEQVVEYFNFAEQKAELHEIEPHVVRVLMSDYSKVMIGGKSRLMIADENSTPTYITLKDCCEHNSDLSIRYSSLSATGKRTIKSENVFKIFMDSKFAPKFGSVKFNPKHTGDFSENGINIKNIFKGYKYEASQISIKLVDKASLFSFIRTNYPKALRFFEHLHDNICDGDWLAFQQLIAWLSDIINRPSVRPLFGVVMRSDEKGTGKSIIYEVMNTILGNMAFSSSTVDQVFGKFNAHLQYKLLVCGEEMSWGGDRGISSKMKDAITASTMQIEPKGIDVITIDKFYRVMLIDNSEWLVNASKDERRYLILQVNPQQAQNDEYFAELMLDGKPIPIVCEDVFGVLSSISHNVNMTRAYETEALVDQKHLSMSSIEQWLYEALDKESEVSLTGFKKVNFSTRLTKAEIHHAYLAWYDNVKPATKDRCSNRREFGRKFINHVLGGNEKILHCNNHGYLINVELARAHFNNYYSVNKS